MRYPRFPFSAANSLGETIRIAIVGFVIAITAPWQSTEGSPPYLNGRFDSTKVLGYEQCQKCHAEQVTVLKQHAHFAHARSLQRDPAAIQMAKAVGGSSVKRTALCIRCHYTEQSDYQPGQTTGRAKAVSAISCESCHGPSKDWLLVHNDYGGTNILRETETAEHRTGRIDKSIGLGMRHPSHLYTLTRSCFRCHITDDEQLVNVAGHVPRSDGFNMVSWTQGSMRHNFFRTGGRQNAFSDPIRLRTMYVVSVLTELEFSLRAAAKSTARARYASSHARHCRKIQQDLAAICQRLSDPRLAEALKTIESVKFSLANAPSFADPANSISRIAWEFSLNPGGDLLAIDELLPAPTEYRGIANR